MRPATTAPLLALLVASLFLLSAGCVQSQAPDRCASYSGPEKDDCLTYMAVWYQDPYACYSVSDLDLRGSCLQEATSPDAQQKLVDKQAVAERARLQPSKYNVPSALPPAPAPRPAAPTDPKEKAIQDCVNIEKSSLDFCLRKVATERQDMALCERIQDDEFRTPCVSNVALTSKSSAACSKLSRDEDRQLCLHYSSG